MAGQEGFEPTTRGFGIRCSSRWSYCPSNLFTFTMRSMLTTKLTEFLKFQLIRCFLLILRGGVIFSLTRSTIQIYRNSHTQLPRP